MKRKALLLIIPFAAAGMVGCTQSNPTPEPTPQCDTSKVKISRTELSLKPGATFQLEVNGADGCNYSWSSSNESVATVVDGLVTAGNVEGTADIKYGNGSDGVVCVVTVNKDAPTPTKHAGTAEDPFDGEDALTLASSLEIGGVSDKEYYIKDVVTALAKDFDPSFGSYSFKFGDFICWQLYNGASKQKFSEGDIAVDDEVTVFAKIQRYGDEGTPETKDGYVVEVRKEGDPEPVLIESIKTQPSEVQQGMQPQLSAYTLVVKMSDNSTVEKNPTAIVVDTSVIKDNVPVTLSYLTLTIETTINVVAKGQTQHAGTKDDPYTPGDAAIVANGLEITTDSKNPIATDQQYYIKGTVSKLAKDFDAKYGSYSFWLGADEFEVWQIYNGSEKAKFNEGDIAPGDEVVVLAKIMNFKGTPENTTDSYVVSVTREAKEIVSVDSVKSSPSSVYVGESIDASKVVLNVTYSDSTNGTVNAESVTCDTSVENASATATAYYKSFQGVEFNIAVVAKPAPASVNVEYSFNKLVKDDTNEYDESKTLAAFTDGLTLGNGIVTAVTPSKVYAGDNTLRVGSSSKGGSLAITSSANVTQVVVTARAYKDTELNTITIGSQTETVKVESSEFVYPVTSTKSITIETSKRVFIEKIGFVAEGITPVDPAVKSVTVSPKSVELAEAATKQLSVVVDAVGGAAETVNWTVIDANPTGCVTVSNDGLVEAVAEGTAKVVATSTFDSSKSDYCEVTVANTPTPVQELDSIEIKVAPVKTIYYEGQTFNKNGLQVTAHYTNGKVDATIKADDLVCTPSGALTLSDTIITIAYTEGGITKTCELEIEVKSVDPGKGTTEDNPFNADEAYAYAESLGSGNKSESEYYIKGAVTKIETAYSSTYNNITLQLTTTTSNIFKLYRVACTQEQADKIVVGTIVEVKGYIYNYSGTVMETDAGGSFVSIENALTGIEISGNSSIKATESSTYTASPTPSSASLGEVAWSIEEGDSYISLPETKTGSSIEVTGVAVGTAVLKATCGDFSDEFEITVTDPSAIDPYEATFQKGSASSYTGTVTQTINKIDWELNGNVSIDNYVKMSSGTVNSTADRYICTKTAFENEVKIFSLITGDIDSNATVNSVTLTVHSTSADASAGTNANETISGVYVANDKVSFSKPSDSDWKGKFFRVTFNLTNTSKNKGIIVKGAKVEF